MQLQFARFNPKKNDSWLALFHCHTMGTAKYLDLIIFGTTVRNVFKRNAFTTPYYSGTPLDASVFFIVEYLVFGSRGADVFYCLQFRKKCWYLFISFSTHYRTNLL